MLLAIYMVSQVEHTIRRRRISTLVAALVEGNASLLVLTYLAGTPAIPFWLLMSAASVIAAVAYMPALLAASTKWAFRMLVVVGFVGTLLSIANGISALGFKSFNEATTYAEGLALGVNDTHARSGSWPNALASIQTQLPAATPPWPYISDCSGRLCSRVAGYSVVYEFSGDQPRLVVLGGSGGWRAEWDWDKRQWRRMRTIF